MAVGIGAYTRSLDKICNYEVQMLYGGSGTSVATDRGQSSLLEFARESSHITFQRPHHDIYWST